MEVRSLKEVQWNSGTQEGDMVAMAKKENPLYILNKFIMKSGMKSRNEVSESEAKEFLEKIKHLKWK